MSFCQRLLTKSSFRSNNLVKLGKCSFSTSPYPFRPGYGLGSWIPPSVIEGMETEGRLRGKITVLEQILTDLESTTREITLEMNALQNSQSGDQTIPIPDGLDGYLDQLTQKRSEIYGKKIQALQELFQTQQDLANDDNPLMSVQAFNAGAMSPVKWNMSEVIFKERSSDSITINARFFNFDKKTQDANAFASTIGQEASAEVRGMGSNAASASVAQEASNSVRKTAQNRNIESTLLLTAKATHSKVMQFGNCVFDEMLLMNAWNFFYGGQGNLSDASAAANQASGNFDPERIRLDVSRLSPSDIYYNRDIPQYISMVSEMFMGSVFIGMVHFLQKEKESQGITQGRASIAANVKFSAWLGALTGDGSIAASVAKNAMANSSSNEYDIKFDLLCLGYTPPINQSLLTTTVKEFKDFDPGNFKIDYNNDSGDQSEAGASDTQAQNKRQANMKAVISSTVESVSEVDQRTGSVLDMKSFMDSFKDYCDNAPNKDGVGIPIGMNVRSWTRDQIAILLWNKYIVGQQVPGTEDTTQVDQQEEV